MLACPRCTGFIPDHLRVCPHCASAPSRRGRLGRALLGLTGMITLAACYGAPPPIDTCVDQDGDGWFPGCYNDDGSCDPADVHCDCDDLDPTVNPGAIDPVGDGRDLDCDSKDGQRPGGPIDPPDPGVVDAGVWADAAP